MRPAPEWKKILRKAWSVRLMAAAFVLTMAEAMIPFFHDDIPRRAYAMIVGLVVAGAFVARLVAQKDFD